MKKFAIFAAIVICAILTITLSFELYRPHIEIPTIDYTWHYPPSYEQETSLNFNNAAPPEISFPDLIKEYDKITFGSVSDLLVSFTKEVDETIDERNAQISDTLSTTQLSALRYSDKLLSINDKYGYLITKFGYTTINQAISETGFDKTNTWQNHLKKAANFEAAIDELLAEELGRGFDKATNTMDNNNVTITVTDVLFRPNGFVYVEVTLTNKSETEAKPFDRLACDGISFWLYDNDGNRLHDVYPYSALWSDNKAGVYSSVLVPPKTTVSGTVIYDAEPYNTVQIFFVPLGGGILEGSEITVNR